MGNTIALPVSYSQALDLVFHLGSKTAVLDVNSNLITIVGKEMKFPKITLDGLAETDRNGDLVEGDVSYEFETKTPDYDRNRVFKVDAVDEKEVGGLFSKLSGLFLNEKVIPEVDAVRFAKYASYSGITDVAASIADGAALVTALIALKVAMDEDEIPPEGRILFINATINSLLLALDTTKRLDVLKYFSQVIEVPQTRFYTAITLRDGKTAGQTQGGFYKKGSTHSAWAAATAYVLNDEIIMAGKIYKCTTAGTSGATAPTWPATGTVADGAGALVWTFLAKAGYDINFLCIHPSAILQGMKHVQPNADSPDTRSDKWRVSYRLYGVNELFDNKLKGVYCHHKAS